jgi:hypothetical protein
VPVLLLVWMRGRMRALLLRALLLWWRKPALLA